MAAVNPNGGQKYWVNGQADPGIKNNNAATGTQKYWFNGTSATDLFPASASGNFFLMFY